MIFGVARLFSSAVRIEMGNEIAHYPRLVERLNYPPISTPGAFKIVSGHLHENAPFHHKNEPAFNLRQYGG